ncbi:diguanylate cyclase (GGDEF)-like protein [Sphingomonas sp. PvP055]|uniref:putative bifunctional diguanylate cyclase/phosphodiesterase n=1 Tax=Sphingomonas sp. PvP055 TaxID=3156391 RepID=UPI003394D3AB
MSIRPSSQFTKPRIDVRALLGLLDPTDTTEWGPIRAAQLNAGSRLSGYLVAANGTGAALVVAILSRSVSLPLLAAWGVSATAVSILVTVRRHASRHRSAYTATLRDVRQTLIDGILLGGIWSVPPIITGLRGDTTTALYLWVALSLMMTASSVAMAALPLATLSFLAILGVSIAARMLLTGSPMLTAAVLAFTAVLIVTCFTRAKSLVLLRTSEIAIAERDETVSLLLREAEEHSSDWLWETDAQRRVVRASPRFATSVGLDTNTVNGKSLLEVLAGPAWAAGKVAPELARLAEYLKGRDAFRGLNLPVMVGTEERWFEIAANPRYDERAVFIGFRGVGSDVTEQRASADEINRMARFDALTGLPNRLLINETLAGAMADAAKWGSRCAFMMIDLDRFKAVNDTLGHPVGDRLLGRVSERLAILVTENEIIGRLGGDEFAVVVRDATDTKRVERLAQTIVDALGQPYELDQHTLYTGASVGVAIGPRDGNTAETLVRSADLALYRSKDAGGGTYHRYEPQLHVVAEERRVLEQALRHALAKNQLHICYQPVVDAEFGRLTGFEALVRWTHPELGVIPPDKFIPLAEDARLIAPIGEWVLRNACAEAARWAGSVRIAVNVSAEQLHNPGFVGIVTSALGASGLPAARLELEVTESVFMRDTTAAGKVLERILDLGVRLSLDDFGTGYSSLGYLSRTRFSTIKIDRSFVTAASNGVREAVAIIRAVVTLAQSLGMTTTAEGVETEEEYRMVRDLACTKVQGYYFGRPLTVEDARVVALRAAQDRAVA